MKTLYIVRHAKSSWEFNLEDHKRPLNNRGLRDAELVGNKLKELVKSIDKVYSSDAVRAKTTANIVLGQMGLGEDILTIEPKLYDFNGHQVIEVIKACDKGVDTLMIFGHNHAFTSIVNLYGSTIIDNLPTAGAVGIQFNIQNWSEIEVGKTVLTVFPKTLR